jgi:hypothetical protein
MNDNITQNFDNIDMDIRLNELNKKAEKIRNKRNKIQEDITKY